MPKAARYRDKQRAKPQQSLSAEVNLSVKTRGQKRSRDTQRLHPVKFKSSRVRKKCGEPRQRAQKPGGSHPCRLLVQSQCGNDADDMVHMERKNVLKTQKRDKKRRKKAASSFDLAVVEGWMRNFVENPEWQRFPLPKYTQQQRLQVHTLAQRYSLICKSYGDEEHSGPVLVKTGATKAPSLDETAGIVARSKKFGKADLGPQPWGRRKMLMAREGAPISDDNIGNKLLMKMGWAGGGLGSNSNGIAEPLKFTVNRGKAGIR